MEPERIKVMRFAENNRISHRQLFRQIILVFPAPFLLCLFKNGAMLGISAMAGTAAAAVVLSFYVIWLIRLTPAYGELSKRTGSFTVRFIGLFFLVYVIASSAFLSGLLGEVIPESLISGISGKWLSLLAVAACSLGTHRGMQRRGRIAEVSGRIFLAGILLLMLDTVRKLGLCTGQEAKVLVTMAQRKINAVTSTSAGRLFDGVSAILGIRRASTFEGEASTALEFAAEAWRKQREMQKKNPEENLKIRMSEKEDIPEGTGISEASEDERKFILNTGEIVAYLVRARLAGEDPGKLAYGFHRALADKILAACEEAERQTGIRKVALSGGVFQNRLLLELVDDGLTEMGFKVLKHSLIPPNDGGIALGQAVYGMAYVQRHR